MKIDNIKINSFGKIKNQSIEFTDGINIVYGENESGKSTILKFISAILYGASKNKNGKNISDFDKFKPWNESEFSGKIKYTLKDGKSYEVFREFGKKNPILYNEFGEDISKEFKVIKGKELNFFEQQVKIDEKTFSNTAMIGQQEVKLEKNDTNTIVQKISNLVSTGDDNISFRKSIEKINKMQNENIGTDRTKQKPINIVDSNIKRLLEEKKKLSSYKENINMYDKERKNIDYKLAELNIKKEELKDKKTSAEDTNFENAKKKVNIYTYLFIFFIMICVIMFAVVKNIVAGIISIVPIIIIFILMRRKSNVEFENFKKSNKELIKKYEEKQEKIQTEINQLHLRKKMVETEKENIDKNLEELVRIEENLEEEQNIKEELISLNISYELAKECLCKAYDEIKHNISPKFEKNLCEIISSITDGKYNNVTLNDENGVCTEVENGSYMPIDRLSIGTIDEMYLSLRLSTLSEISNENLPIILDETFAYFDNNRLKNIMRYLQDQNYDNQIIIFTCTNREEDALNDLKIEYNLINLEK